MKEIAAHNIAGWVQAATVGNLYHLSVGIGMGIGCIWIGWGNADVMAGNSWYQLALCCDHPIFEVRRQPVSIRENEIRCVSVADFHAPVRGAGERGDHHCQRRRRIAGIFFPALLRCHRPSQNQTGSCTQNYYARIEEVERMVFMQTPRQQYRESNLIKLQPGPVGGPVDPTVLRKTAIRPLDPRQPDQRAQRRSSLACGEKRACTLYEVACPDQMVTTKVQIPFGLAPRNAH